MEGGVREVLRTKPGGSDGGTDGVRKKFQFVAEVRELKIGAIR